MTARRALAAALLVGLVVGGCAAEPSARPGSTASPTALPLPTPAPSPAATASPLPSLPTSTPSSAPSPSPGAATGAAGRPTRVAMPSLGIDLPIVVPPRRSTWPLCDVAEYFRPPAFQHPGRGGVTYIYAHAQEGMFLPILEASRRRNGRAMIGDRITVWTVKNHRYTYRVTEVRRFQKSLGWAYSLPPNSLVLQTSEDQYRTGSKVMVVARQEGDPVLAPEAEANPPAKPRVCGH